MSNAANDFGNPTNDFVAYRYQLRRLIITSVGCTVIKAPWKNASILCGSVHSNLTLTLSDVKVRLTHRLGDLLSGRQLKMFAYIYRNVVRVPHFFKELF